MQQKYLHTHCEKIHEVWLLLGVGNTILATKTCPCKHDMRAPAYTAASVCAQGWAFIGSPVFIRLYSEALKLAVMGHNVVFMKISKMLEFPLVDLFCQSCIM